MGRTSVSDARHTARVAAGLAPRWPARRHHAAKLASETMLGAMRGRSSPPVGPGSMSVSLNLSNT